MKNLYYISSIIAIILGGCNQPDQPLEEFYQFKTIQSLYLYEPQNKELLIGDEVNLLDLLEITDAQKNPVSVPNEALQFLVNNTSYPTSSFKALSQGTYIFRVKMGNKTSNSVTVIVLPPGVFPIVKIPVVFHTVNSTLSQTQINNLINGLTASFRNRWNPTNSPKDQKAADCYLEFYAAEKDPTGKTISTKGLNIVSSSQSAYTDEQAVDEVWNKMIFWDPNRFLNVWVFNVTGELEDASWAYFTALTRFQIGGRQRPKGSNPDVPIGVFFNQKHVNGSGNVETLAHEVGHVLNLNHVFDGNLNTFNGCTDKDPDYCSDTPYYDRKNYEQNYRSLQQRRLSCDGISYLSTNYMDYYISYKNSFTPDQRTRIRHTISYGLWLPTPFNGAPNGRISSDNYIKKPNNYQYTPPIVCAFGQLKPSK